MMHAKTMQRHFIETPDIRQTFFDCTRMHIKCPLKKRNKLMKMRKNHFLVPESKMHNTQLFESILYCTLVFGFKCNSVKFEPLFSSIMYEFLQFQFTQAHIQPMRMTKKTCKKNEWNEIKID